MGRARRGVGRNGPELAEAAVAGRRSAAVLESKDVHGLKERYIDLRRAGRVSSNRRGGLDRRPLGSVNETVTGFLGIDAMRSDDRIFGITAAGLGYLQFRAGPYGRRGGTRLTRSHSPKQVITNRGESPLGGGLSGRKTPARPPSERAGHRGDSQKMAGPKGRPKAAKGRTISTCRPCRLRPRRPSCRPSP